MTAATARPSPALEPALPGEGIALDSPKVGAVHVYAAGSGGSAAPPVLLVHTVNAAASAYEIRPIYEALAESEQGPVYALDLPGYGLSERSERAYDPRLMTDALHATLDRIGEREGDRPVDLLGVSLSSEFVARAAAERPDRVRSLALVSPTGLDGRPRRDGPEGSTLGKGWVKRIVTCSWWDDFLFDNLTRPGVVRYFLQRTWGAKDIDEELWAYCVASARQPGAKHAPFAFLSGFLFSGDVMRVYEGLHLPVWASHGVRGDFVDYRRLGPLAQSAGWRVDRFETGALPYFEVPGPFLEKYAAFRASLPGAPG